MQCSIAVIISGENVKVRYSMPFRWLPRIDVEIVSSEIVYYIYQHLTLIAQQTVETIFQNVIQAPHLAQILLRVTVFSNTLDT